MLTGECDFLKRYKSLEQGLGDFHVDPCTFSKDISLERDILEPLRSFARSLILGDGDASPEQFLENLLPVLETNRHLVEAWVAGVKRSADDLFAWVDGVVKLKRWPSLICHSDQKECCAMDAVRHVIDHLSSDQLEYLKTTDVWGPLESCRNGQQAANGLMLLILKVLTQVALFDEQRSSVASSSDDNVCARARRLFFSNGSTIQKNVTLVQSDLRECETISLENVCAYHQFDGFTAFVGYNESEVVSFTKPAAEGPSTVVKFRLPESYHPLYVGRGYFRPMGLVLLFSESKQSYGLCVVALNQGRPDFEVLYFDESFDNPLLCAYDTDDSCFCVAFDDARDAQCFKRVDQKLVRIDRAVCSPFCQSEKWRSFVSGYDASLVNQTLFKVHCDFIIHNLTQYPGSLPVCFMDLVTHIQTNGAQFCTSADELLDILGFLNVVCSDYKPSLASLLTVCCVLLSLIPVDDCYNEDTLASLLDFYEQAAALNPMAHDAILFGLAVQSERLICANREKYLNLVDSLISQGNVYCSLLAFTLSFGLVFLPHNYDAYFRVLSTNCPVNLAIEAVVKQLYLLFTHQSVVDVSKFQGGAARWLGSFVNKGVKLPTTFWTALCKMGSDFIGEVAATEFQKGFLEMLARSYSVGSHVDLFLFQYGEYLSQELLKFPVEEDEKSFEIVLDSNMLKIDASIDDELGSIALVKRTLSQGLSFSPDTEADCYDRAIMSGFLKDLVASGGPTQIAKGFEDFLIKKLRVPAERFLGDDLKRLRRLTAAVLIRHLGATESAVGLAFAVSDGNMDAPISGAIKLAWDESNRFVRDIKCQCQSGSSFDELGPKYEEKLNFLLNKEPVMRILLHDMERDNVVNTKREVVSSILKFVKCEGSVSSIETILAKRARRCFERQRTLERISFLRSDVSPVHFSFLQGGMLAALLKIMTRSNLGSLSNEMVRPVNEHLTNYVRFVLQQISDADVISCGTVDVIRCAFGTFISREDKRSMMTEILSEIEKKTETSKSLLWYFVIRMAFTHPRDVPQILEHACSRFTTQEDRDICDTLQAVMLHNSQGMEKSTQILNCATTTESAMLKTLVVISSQQCNLLPEQLLSKVVFKVLQTIRSKRDGDMENGLRMWRILMSSSKQTNGTIITDICRNLILSREYGDSDLLSVLMAFGSSNRVMLSRKPYIIDPWILDDTALGALIRLCEKAVPDEFGDYLLKFCCWLALSEENVSVMSKSNLLDVLNKVTKMANTELPSRWCYETAVLSKLSSRADDIWTSQALTSNGICLKTRGPHIWELTETTWEGVWIQVTFVTKVSAFEIGFVFCGDTMPFSGIELGQVDEKAQIRTPDGSLGYLRDPIGLQGQTYIFGFSEHCFFIVNKQNGEYYKVSHNSKYRLAIPVIAVTNVTLDDVELMVVPISFDSVPLTTRVDVSWPECTAEQLDMNVLSFIDWTLSDTCCVDIWAPPGSTCQICGEEWIASKWLVDGKRLVYEVCRRNGVTGASELWDLRLDLLGNMPFLSHYGHIVNIYKDVRYLKVLLGMKTSTLPDMADAILELTTLLNPFEDIIRDDDEAQICDFMKAVWYDRINEPAFLGCLNKTLVNLCGQTFPKAKLEIDVTCSFWPQRFIWNHCRKTALTWKPIGTMNKTCLSIATGLCYHYRSRVGRFERVLGLLQYDRSVLASATGLRVLITTIKLISPDMCRTIISDDTVRAMLRNEDSMRLCADLLLLRLAHDVETLRDYVVIPMVKCLAEPATYLFLFDVIRKVQAACNVAPGPCVCRHLSNWGQQANAKFTEFIAATQKLLAVGNPKKFCFGCFYDHINVHTGGNCRYLSLDSGIQPELKEVMTDTIMIQVRNRVGAGMTREAIVTMLKEQHQMNEDMGNAIVVMVEANQECHARIFPQIRQYEQLVSAFSEEQIMSPPGYARRFILQGISSSIRSRPNLQIDRISSRESMLSQLKAQVPLDNTERFRRELPWHIYYVGEHGIDAGGLARDFLTVVCQEVLQPDMGLFELTPNGKRGEGPNQTVLIPSLTANPLDLEYVGVLMGIAYWCQLPQEFKFPRLVWSYLTKEHVDIQDICDIDTQFSQLVNTPSIQLDDITLVDIWGRPRSIGMASSARTQSRDGLMKLWVYEQKKTIESVLKPLADGLRRMIPSPSGFRIYFFPGDLETDICGADVCPTDQLVKLISVQEGLESLVSSALEMLTDEERLGFVGFVTGCRRLPPPGVCSWSIRINVHESYRGLPVAHTCFKSVDIQRYCTPEEFAAHIRVCIKWGGDFNIG